MRVEDLSSGATVAFRLAGAKRVSGQTVDGYLVFAGAHPSGASLLHRALPSGTEDYVSFQSRPAAADVRYVVTLGPQVAGLRLIEGTLEMVDGGGAPRLRMERPYLVGADGVRTNAVVAVEGCAVDSNPAAPWGRQVVPPGASDCTVRVTWPDSRVVYPAVLDPRWTSTSTTMTTTRQGHTATLLSTGNVLVVGGTTNGNTSTSLASAELYNPATNSWAATASMPADAARTLHTATQLKVGSEPSTSGKVLIAGGTNGTAMYNCQLYDPATGTWDQATSFSGLGRYSHTATLLADGTVLITGGIRGSSTLNTAEVYDPSFDSGGWASTTNNMPSALKYHQAVLLTTSNSQLSNKVLVFGGNSGTSTASTVALYTPSTRKFSSLTALASAREGHTATVLPNGNVLVTGGKNGSTTLNTTLLFNPSSGSGTWSSAGTLNAARQGHSATLLSSATVADGTVLVAGGNSGSGTLSSAELWDGTSTWTTTTPLPSPMQNQTATLLSSRAVLLVGGVNGSTTLNTTALYDGSFALTCTSNSQCVTGFCVGGVCCDTACNGGCGVCNLPGKVGTCSAASNTTVCRNGNGVCDPAETCDGTSLNCPADVVTANGTSCTDGNACNGAETCHDGSCQAGIAPALDDGNPCTADACDPSAGVTHTVLANGTSCDDGNRCTSVDSCRAGVCQPGATNSCTTGTFYAAVVDMGQFGDRATVAWGINESGEVVGTGFYLDADGVTEHPYPFRYSNANGLTPIFTQVAGCAYCANSYGTGINASGEIVGGGPAFTQTSGNAAQIVNVPGIGQIGTANAVNDSGVLAGMYGGPNGNQAYRYTPGTGLLPLAPPAGSYGTSQAFGIDADGRVVGFVQAGSGAGTSHAFLYTDAAGMQDLNSTLPPSSGFTVLRVAERVNASYVLGFGTWNDGTTHGFRRHNDGSLDDLGVIQELPSAENDSSLAMNARGDVVGSYRTSSGALHAFVLTIEGERHDLNDYVDPNAGWTLEVAAGINSTFQVVGHAQHAGFPTRAYKIQLPDLTPCAAPDGCHVATTRNPATGLCNYANLTDGTSCDDGNRCTSGDSCHAGTCIPGATNLCTAATDAKYLRIVDIGTQKFASSANAINNNGEVVGSESSDGGIYEFPSDGGRAFRWSESEGKIYLPWAGGFSYGDSINDSGIITGSLGPALDQPNQPFRYDPAHDAAPVVLGTPGNAYGINSSGTTTGRAQLPYQRMIRWNGGTPEILPWAPGNADDETPVGAGIDADGTVVGFETITIPARRFFAQRYSDARGTELLNDLLPAGTTWDLQMANAIRGGVVVGGGLHGAVNRAFRMTFTPAGDFQSITDLGIVPQFAADDVHQVLASNLNASGEIVGAVYDSIGFWPQLAFVYTDATQMVDLNSLVDPQSGWVLNAAFGINDQHEVVGYGQHNGQAHAFKAALPDLTPCPPPPACRGQGVRDLLTGQCSYPNAADGSSCSDGNACTQTDTCQAGACVGGNPVACTAGDACQGAGTCNPATGICSAAAAPDGQACEDGNRCTVGDSCSKGACMPGPSNVCTAPSDNKYARVIDLGASMSASFAHRINHSGEVVGSEKPNGSYFEGIGEATLAYVWSEAAGKVYLPTPMDYADDINDAGVIAGRAGFTYARYDRAHDPAPVLMGMAADRQCHLNASGVVTGGAYFGAPPLLSMLRWNGGSAEQLPTLPSGLWGFGLGIDDDGTVAGYQYVSQDTTEAIRYTDARGTEVLTDLLPPGNPWLFTSASFVRNGVFIGTGTNPAGLHHAYRLTTTPTGDFQSLDDLGVPDGYDALAPNIVEPTQMSANGEIVGAIIEAGANTWPENAFIYTDTLGRPVLLSSLVDPNSGWHLNAALGINDNHEVVGYGTHDGQTRAFKMNLPDLSPCPPPADGCHVPVARDLLTGLCSYPNAADNIACDDQDPTAIGKTCQAGRCVAPSLITPSLVGIAVEGSVTKAIFNYTMTTSTAVTIPYGPANGLYDDTGTLIPAPTQQPPSVFEPTAHPPFVVAIPGTQITWKVNGQSVTADAGALPGLAVTTLSDGTHDVTFLDGSQLNLDSTPPADPVAAAEPTHGDPFNGLLSGSLSVTPSGGAIYSVPISVPPGVAGMAPNLSLVYNSQGGTGLAGQGWQMAGLSVIQRCPKTALRDGAAGPVVMDALGTATSDGLCLDGQKMFEQSPTGSGTYRLEKDDFSGIRLLSSGVFQVTTKSGEIRTYGSATQIVDQPTGQTGIWALDQVTDPWGNFFTIEYNDGKADYLVRGLLPTRIRYTGHETNGAQDVDPFYEVTFQYGPRMDSTVTRIGTTSVPMNQLLSGIVTPRGTYSLQYGQNEFDTPLLAEIDYCAPSDATHPQPQCLKPLTFGWNDNPVGREIAPTYQWTQAPGYAVPADYVNASVGRPPFTNFLAMGSQFVDLNADGLPELVMARNGRSGVKHSFNYAYRNTGTGFDPDHFHRIPVPTFLSQFVDDTHEVPTSVRFADMDGDGRLDIIQGSVQVTCQSPTDCYVCPTNDTASDCPGTTHTASPAVWLNRINEGQGWLYQPEYEHIPFLTQQSIDFNTPQQSHATPYVVADMNGDGCADLIQATFASESRVGPVMSYSLMVNNCKNLTFSTPDSTAGWVTTTFEGRAELSFTDSLPYDLDPAVVDVNRDGLPDLIAYKYVTGPDNVLDEYEVAFINKDGASFLPPIVHQPTASATVDADKNGIANADFDGDGYYDALAFESLYGVNGNLNSYKSQVGIAISDGSGLGFQPSSAVRVKELIATAPSATGDPNDFAFALMDVNGDGLADLIRNHPATTNGHGEVFVNRRNGWETFGGATYIDWSHTTTLNTPVPMVPNDRLACLAPDYGYPAPSGCVGPTPVVNNGTAYVDLDGDGLVDVIKDASTYKDATDGSDSRAWLNKFQVPVITKFPNQLANPTVVTYVSTSSGAAQSGTAPTYTETGIVETGTTYAPVPIRVVASVAKDSAVGPTATTTYQYIDLRNSAYGYGPQGFKAVTVTDPSGISTMTAYAQAYPFTGLPIRVDRTNVLGQLSTTFTTYCLDQSDTQCSNVWNQSVAARQTFFIHPSKIEEHTLVPADITTDTTYQFDSGGNPSVTITTARAAGSSAETATGQVFRTETHNNYGDEGSPTQVQGKVKRTQVITAIDAPAPTSARVHTTSYDYDTRFGALALTKKSIEPDSTDPGMRLDTAYGYDNFGNVKVTTECAADFDHCGDFGATGPAELPYRITLTSYTTSDFNAPSGPGLTSSLGYGDGRFPVKMTDPMGHTSYVAYDPLRGVAIQKTDQNGVHQCSVYDRLGNLTATVARCGSAVPLSTRMDRYEVSDPTLPRELTVMVTRPPVGGATWAYADALGRGTVTRSYGFDGGFTQTETIFDALGRVSSSSKPHKLGDTIFASVPIYDSLSRVQETDSVIGPLTLNGPAYVDQVKSDFSGGLTVPSQHLVNGAWQTRTETKYVNGKVASVKDAKETETDYTYDADGNPYEVRTGGVLLEQTVFDVRGRKTSSFSADMGSWTYVYDGFGELVQQTDGNNHTSTMTYDQLGRLLTRDDQDEGVSQWIYDDPTSGGGIGKLSFMIGPPDTNLGHDCPLPSGAMVSGGNRATKTYHYTQFGQLDTTVECIDGEPFTTTNTYDEFGRQFQIRYPAVGSSQLVVGYHYTSLGFLQYLTDDSTDSAVLWRAIAMNAIGQVTDEQTKNGVETVSATNPTNGWLLRSSAVAHADDNKQIQWLDFSYDQAGNLTRRRRLDSLVSAYSDESFTYDPLNRVHTAAIDVGTPVSYTGSTEYDYDNLGNLTVKDGKQYTNGTGCRPGGQVGPHALCAIDSDGSYAYDGNGNMTAGRGRAVTYNHRNKPKMISDGTNGVQFVYGADGDRVTQIATPASGTEARTIYVGLGATGKSLYERTTTGNDVTNVDFIYAPGAAGINAIAVRTMTTGGAVTGDRYFTFDNVGSTMTVTDESGRLAQDADSRPSLLGYDPWGARRAPEGNPVQPEPTDAPVGNRGFGGHEVVPALGLVNMNGRVYDPDVGRFLSTDPNIQFPTDLQGYNRYAYVLNNPLSHTDPTGYFLGLSGLAWANIGLSVAGIVACAGSGVGCGVIFALAATTLNTTAAVLGGASASQIAGSLIMGTALGVIGGGMGSAVSSVLGGSLGAVVASGAISNVFTASFSTMMSGRLSGAAFGENLMMSVGMGLLQTGVNVLLAQPAPVSQASDASPASAGGGPPDRHSGASDVETLEVKSGATPARGRTVVLYGDVDIYDVDENGRPDPSKGKVWELTKDNEESFVKRLRVSVAKATGWNMRDADFVHVTNGEQISEALGAGDVGRVAWVGHVQTYVHGAQGALMLLDDLVDGKDFANMLAKGTSVKFVGCDSVAVGMEMHVARPDLNITPSAGDLQMNIKWNLRALDQTVTKVWFSPWVHEQSL